METKKLGFGLMRLPVLDPADPGTIDVEQVKQMVDLFLERGFTYFDTAWMYQNFKSEECVKEVLSSRYPRESYTLATKLHSEFFNTPEERDVYFSSQLEKTGAGYFDYYLLHGLDTEMYEKHEKLDSFSWLKEKKEQGLAKHIGFSFHDTAEVLEKILTAHPEMEFVQLQINYLDWENEWVQSRACYETACRHNIPIVVMECNKGGTLAHLPENVEAILKDADPDASPVSWAMRFCAGLPGVFMVLSGMSSLEQMEENTAFMQDFRPLTQEETGLLHKAADLILSGKTIACTACNYCGPGCPQNIPIPKYFSLYNGDKMEIIGKSWTPNKGLYQKLTASFGKASDCIACGQCENMCPQHLPIIEYLKDVAEYMENA